MPNAPNERCEGASLRFFSQQALSDGLDAGTVDLQGEVLAVKRGGSRHALTEAFLFVCLQSGEDALNWLGRVFDAATCRAQGLEICGDCALRGETVYEVRRGWLTMRMD